MNPSDTQQQPIIVFGISNIGCDQSHATFQTIVPDGTKSAATMVNQPEPPMAEPVAGEEPSELCHLIHPSVADEALQWQIHREIEHLVRHQAVPDICSYLSAMAAERKILLPLSPETAIRELHRMGMPDVSTPGFTYKNFCKYYKR